MQNISPKLYRRAFDVLAGEISAGNLTSGSRLTESGLANRFGISRAPARLALSELESRGLVRKSAVRGYEVLALSGGPAFEATTSDRIGADQQFTARLQFLPSWELIYPEIELEVVSRTSLTSWRINEVALAKAYDVSRTVAREVMARLQQRGIVQKDEKGRWQAPALTTKRIDDLYELRWVLEPLALEKAFPQLPPGLASRLSANVQAAHSAFGTVAGEKLDALEQELHVELLSYCGNEALMQALSLPQGLLVAHHFLYQATSALFETEPFLPEHLDVLDHLAAGNIRAAKAALIRHLKISRERAMMRIHSVASTLSPRDLPYLEPASPSKPDQT
ncbi:GntR family transcriptional regulator [Rhizobium deserti]|uniref:GntR family transcriptional regulator n=1 Tax=Rhizobium deserti TaxID=2547961 RepID=A0A4R5U9S4_9HYPH|nr:GntR family transcriptional regulator [Rhizobium deserti]TDK31359.1 GntR family transcriptional regulator [Rhizobium deserti]